ITANGNVVLRNGFQVGRPQDTGAGGNISIEGASVTLEAYTLDPASLAQGNSGNTAITATTGNIFLNSGTIFGDNGSAQADSRGGNISLNGNTITLDNYRLNANNFGNGEGGSIFLNAEQDIELQDSEVLTQSSGDGVGGDISLNSDGDITITNSSIDAETSSANENGLGGDITVSGESILIQSGSELTTTSNAQASAGNIVIGSGENATENAASVTLSDNSSIRAEAFNMGGQAGNVDIQTQVLITEEASIQTSNVDDPIGGNITLSGLDILTSNNTSISAGTFSGVAGDININGEGDTIDTIILVDSTLEAEAFEVNGQAGNVDIQAQSLTVENSSIEASNINAPTGGNVVLQGLNTFTAENSTIEASTQSGVAGDIDINAEEDAANRITLTGSFITAEATEMGGQAGNVDIQTQVLDLKNSEIEASNINDPAGGSITLGGLDSLIAENSTIEAGTQSGVAGDIDINAEEEAVDNITLVNSSITVEATATGGQAGNVDIQTQTLSLNDSTIQASNIDDPAGGSITLGSLNSLTAENSSTIETSTQSGVAGDIDINSEEEAVDNITLVNSSITAEATATGGQAGNVDIQTQTLNLNNSEIAASNINDPNGGNITIEELNDLAVVNSNITTRTDSGTAGDIDLTVSGNTVVTGENADIEASANEGTAGSVTLRTENLEVLDGGAISVSSGEAGAAGGLDITANRILLDNGSLTAETGAAGGEASAQITLNLANDQTLENLLWLRNESVISAEAIGGDASGGNIDIVADFIIAEFPTGDEGSDIFADAGEGAGGRIRIDALGVFGIQVRPERTPLNDITASSEAGVQGTVELNTLTTDPNRGLAELAIQFIDASDQTSNQCRVDSSGESSEVTVAGRGGLPTMPTAVLGAVTSDEADWVTLDSTPEGSDSDETMASIWPGDEGLTATSQLHRQATLCHRAYRSAQTPL
ncbi:MAG: S-layer family protein, partial [Leptolyngbya sp. SIO1D8]|nr:S-layer family protein [Leptolyngbya sp. SIO1D8]